jgi:hypothetical protein
MDAPVADLLFPPRLASSVSDARGPAWQKTVSRAVQDGVESRDMLALVLTVARLSGCIDCNSDSYRAAQGCTACAGQALKRYPGTDHELVKLYDNTRGEVEAHLARHPAPASHPESI